MSMLYGHRNGNTCSCNLKIKRSKYLRKLWCCVGGRIYHNVIWYYHLNWWRKLAAVNSFSWRFECKPFCTVSNEGLTIETSALKLFTVTNLRHQFNWYWQIALCYILPPTQHHSYFRNIPPLTCNYMSKCCHFYVRAFLNFKFYYHTSAISAKNN